MSGHIQGKVGVRCVVRALELSAPRKFALFYIFPGYTMHFVLPDTSKVCAGAYAYMMGSYYLRLGCWVLHRG